jgi:fatty acid desaturase
MGRYLFLFTAIVFAASTAAFLLYVTLMPLIAVALVVVGLVLMFILGMHTRDGFDLVRPEKLARPEQIARGPHSYSRPGLLEMIARRFAR